MIFVERSRPETVEQVQSALEVSGPVAAVGDDDGSTWYCTAGVISPDASTDHLVVVTNPTDQPVSGTITVYPSQNNTIGEPVPYDPAVQAIEVPANGQLEVSLAPIVILLDEDLALPTGAFVGALVEFDSGGLTVHHAQLTPFGSDLEACATSAAATWWFAAGTTLRDVSYQMFLLNPFPDDAVVDITFVRADGIRTPNAVAGRLVRAQSLTVIDLTPVQPVLDQVTAEITTRTGRVIAERVQFFGPEGEGPRGVSLTAGTNALSDQWFFPAGGAVAGAGESYVIFNPNEGPAEVEFELKTDADVDGDTAPRQVPVGPSEWWVVNAQLHPTHPLSQDTAAAIDVTGPELLGAQYFVSVRSFNETQVSAERVLTQPLESGLGVASSFGISQSSTDQLLAIPPWLDIAATDPTGDDVGELAVLNPAGDTISRIEIWVGGQGQLTLRESSELPPRRRAAFDLGTLLQPGDEWIQVRSSTGVMAEMVTVTNNGIAVTHGVPAEGSVSVPNLFSFD